jgi:hypothetical protein
MTAFGTGPNSSILFFYGPMARAEYGGPVPLTSVGPNNFLTSQNFYHLGNPSGVGSEPRLHDDLMNGIVFDPNYRYEVLSSLDRAILQDLGWEVAVPTKPMPVRYAVGAGGGDPLVTVYGRNHTRLFRFRAYDQPIPGGVRVATGDVTGDGVKDVVTAPGPGAPPNVRVFDGRTGRRVASFLAYTSTFTGGVFVAVGDVNRDGRADVITGPDVGAQPMVKAFSGADLTSTLRSFSAYATGFKGGVRVAAADVDGDGHADIITGPGPRGGATVKVFDGASGGLMSSFATSLPGPGQGVYVGAGDTDGDGLAEIVTATATRGPRVQLFSGTGTLVRGYIAPNGAPLGGVRVALVDTNGDNRADIVTGPDRAGGTVVNIRRAKTLADLGSFVAFDPPFGGGVYVG